MVYIASWDEFVERSVQLFRANPQTSRYVMKYRHCDGKLVLKVTDNRECLKFKTDQAQDAKKMEKLNNIFFTLMARGPDADISEVSGKEQVEPQPSKKVQQFHLRKFLGYLDSSLPYHSMLSCFQDTNMQ
ncbi:signal recognition particle protein [Cinnamomum micranthum f. kanehirae]|uniref:Signal recognition particle 9 kDa protein n=1 Tax=Cinnamomum micranthum f. kanehirae TaxID=337451 RepID=A0A443PF96_9MAGN|nr:signal recognition particle protein [Cinnamomum micranthum f. kanehirae]